MCIVSSHFSPSVMLHTAFSTLCFNSFSQSMTKFICNVYFFYHCWLSWIFRLSNFQSKTFSILFLLLKSSIWAISMFFTSNERDCYVTYQFSIIITEQLEYVHTHIYSCDSQILYFKNGPCLGKPFHLYQLRPILSFSVLKMKTSFSHFTIVSLL